MRPGGESSSVFSLIAATVGGGTLAFPYAIWLNGIAFGTFLILLGAVISCYSGLLIVKASNFTGKHRYEDMAQVLYGKKFSIMTSLCNLICLMGFVMSFIVYVSIITIFTCLQQKESLPQILLYFFDKDKVPYFLQCNFYGQCFWGTIYTVRPALST